MTVSRPCNAFCLCAQTLQSPKQEIYGPDHEAFRELAGTDLAGDTATSMYQEQYAHGGMSSGMISLDTWRQRLMPVLAERARTRLPSRPRATNPDHPPLTP